MFQGTKVTLGDREFVIPPISLGLLRGGLADKIKAHDALFDRGNSSYNELLMARGEIIIAVLRRNYSESEISDNDLWDRLDFGNVPTAWSAILALNGFDLGEVTAAAINAANTTSSNTIPLSPPATDGLTETLTNLPSETQAA